MITVYSTGCPRCKIIETKLKEKNIDFTVNDNIDEMSELGIMSVPVLSIDGKLFQFKEANDWINEQEGQNED